MIRIPERYSGWLRATNLQTVFDVLEAAGGAVRVNGGAVRNSLLGEPAGDVDLSTTLLPEAVIEALAAAGIKPVPTGIEHGTVTAVAGSEPFEITTLREDIETDGRHAVVRFGSDWTADARRRDFTMNALYCDRIGTVFDPLGGLADLRARQVRFIGDASQRIGEDRLRILRFFRFFAWYGAGRPDAAGLKACARLKGGLAEVSAERIWAELKKLLAAPSPTRALLWMRTSGVLGVVLPESEGWGIDLVGPLIAAESRYGFARDPLLRLAAMVRPLTARIRQLAARLKLSKSEAERLIAWANSTAPEADIPPNELYRLVYRGDRQGIIDAMRLAAARHLGKDETEIADRMAERIHLAAAWERPKFPLSGRDLTTRGIEPGPALGEKLKSLEEDWVESDFTLTPQALLERL